MKLLQRIQDRILEGKGGTSVWAIASLPQGKLCFGATAPPYLLDPPEIGLLLLVRLLHSRVQCTSQLRNEILLESRISDVSSVLVNNIVLGYQLHV